LTVVVLRWPVKEVRIGPGKSRCIIRTKAPTARLECEATLVGNYLHVNMGSFGDNRVFSRKTLCCSQTGMGDYILEHQSLPEEALFSTRSTFPVEPE